MTDHPILVIGVLFEVAALCTIAVCAIRAPTGEEIPGVGFVPLARPNRRLPRHQNTSEGNADALRSIAPVLDPDRGGELDFHEGSDGR